MILKDYAPENAKVFDPFMGSGTTALACKSLNLDWCGCELEPDYVEIANKRLKAVQMSIFSLDGVD
jgi:DNA modification methylase